MMSQGMSGKVAVVSGASTGVGRAVARRLATDGATVVLLARREKLLDELAADIGSQAVPLVTDVTSGDSVRAAFQQVAARFGRIDALVNSAGITRISAIEEASDQDIAESVGTNLIGPMYTTRSAVPLLRASGGGDIINISSEITLDHMPLMSLYAASKHGLNGFTSAMARDLRRDAIRVTLIILGAVGDTGIYENFGDGMLEKAWPIWEADGYLTRMSGNAMLVSATVADVLHHIVTRPPELMLDVVHIRPAPTGTAG
jgi:NAD(P)-dependent dehydrogenase (short-subunit alcohol dehydrogenase family)